MSESTNFKERVILAGDANINMDEVTKIGQNSTLVVENLKQITEKSGFQQLVTEVTREGTVKCKAKKFNIKTSKKFWTLLIYLSCYFFCKNSKTRIDLVFTGLLQHEDNKSVEMDQQTCVCVTDESRDVSDHKFLRIIVKKSETAQNIQSEIVEFSQIFNYE